MKPPTLRTAVYLTLDVALLVVCIIHIPSLLERSKIPFEADRRGGHVMAVAITDPVAAGDLRAGDRVIRWGNDTVLNYAGLEFLADQRGIGESVTLTVSTSGVEHVVTITLIPFYVKWYILIVLIVGIITWGVGVFILLARPGERAAGALQWSLVCMGISVMIAWGRAPPGDLFPLLTRALFFIVYSGVGSIFLYFTTLFPRPRYGPVALKRVVIFLPALILLVLLLWTHLRAFAGPSLAAYREFCGWFDLFQVLKLVYVAAGLWNVIHSYRTADSSAERKRMQWILWGLAIGPTPFLLLITLPELFLPAGLVPEEATLIFLVIIPVSFAISFVKYRLLDIEVVIKRTTVYALVLAGVLALYIGAVGSVSVYVGSFVPEVSAVAAILIALLFEPVRRQVQRLIDKRFFRVQYNLREATRRFLADIEHAVDERHLGVLLVRRTGEVIPVERMGIFTLTGNRLHLLAQEGFARLEGRGIPFSWQHLRTSLGHPVALEGAVETGVETGRADGGVFRRWGMALVFPILGEKDSALGFIVLGPKKSGLRFSAEDVDLMAQVADESGLALERIVLQRRFLLEQAETRRLDELNRMKSDFVSYVSHELRTPLTSIKMFTEMMLSPAMRLGKKAHEYMRIIEGEADRLGRMVSTILDSARIEQGVEEYHFTSTDLALVVRKALSAMSFQLEQRKFRVTTRLLRGRVPVLADADAVSQAVVNIVANSIKYSTDKKSLTVRLLRAGETLRLSVTDRGPGIPAESLPHLFERFYRDPTVKRKIQGVGLGLPLVRHIMDAHGGHVEVESTVGKGSTFTLVFPCPAKGAGMKKQPSENQV